jgi:hypothetical protein
MARSIHDWYLDRESGSMGNSSDDEVVERQAPWDVIQTRPRTAKKAAGRGGGGGDRSGDAAAAPKKLGRRSSRTGASKPTSGRVPQQRSTPDLDMSAALQGRITIAIRLHPGASAKQVAASMRAAGSPVSRAQVADVLRRLSAAGRKGSQEHERPAAKATTTFAMRQPLRQSSPQTLICNACGILVSGLGLCRCS